MNLAVQLCNSLCFVVDASNYSTDEMVTVVLFHMLVVHLSDLLWSGFYVNNCDCDQLVTIALVHVLIDRISSLFWFGFNPNSIGIGQLAVLVLIPLFAVQLSTMPHTCPILPPTVLALISWS